MCIKPCTITIVNIYITLKSFLTSTILPFYSSIQLFHPNFCVFTKDQFVFSGFEYKYESYIIPPYCLNSLNVINLKSILVCVSIPHFFFQSSISFYECRIFVYVFICRQMLRLFLILSIINKADVNIHMEAFIWTCFHFSSLMSRMDRSYDRCTQLFEKVPNCFPISFYIPAE